MPDIKLGSLFDGIGVFPLAASRCGIRPVWASEIEKAPISITKRHFPDMVHLGDITKVDGGKIPPVHVITFGSPCQNLSLIGNRSGLAGAKSSLFYQAFRIIQEMRDATDNLYPATLLHMMGGLDIPTSGTVIVRDEELAKKNDEQLTIFRRRNIGFIFQNYNLVPILNVYENIVLPVELDGDTVDQKFLDEIVHLLGLEDKLKNMPNNLSGGQQQRVAIARALITKPAIVLADEPTGNLDSKTSAEVLGLIKRTSAEFRQTVVMITHNNDIARLADRIVRIEDGKIVE